MVRRELQQPLDHAPRLIGALIAPQTLRLTQQLRVRA
jgi:hypothetical protein